MTMETSEILAQLRFDGGGLIACVTQDDVTGAVLMLGCMNRDAIERTIETREMHYYSRSRAELWHKGGTSGNVQRVVSLTRDCDGDAILARVRPAGPTCHTGTPTCFGVPLGDAIGALQRVILARAASFVAASRSAESAERSYTHRLLGNRNLRLKKLSEEAGELALACADGAPAAIAEEAADLLYHILVAINAGGVTLDDVRRVLDARARRSVADGMG